MAQPRQGTKPVWTTLPVRRCDPWGCPVQGQRLDSVVPFQVSTHSVMCQEVSRPGAAGFRPGARHAVRRRPPRALRRHGAGRCRACAAAEGAEPVGMWRLARAGARAPPALVALAAAAGAGPGGHGGTEGWYEWAARSPPVHWAEGGLAALQEATGLPCWAAIAGGAALLRTAVTLPLAAQQGRLLAKVRALRGSEGRTAGGAEGAAERTSQFLYCSGFGGVCGFF